jgi:PilZ domain-containing protein
MEAAMSGRSPDRRTSPRTSIEEHGIVSARVRPGHRVAVIDVSAGGAQIEGANRLLPGAAVDLQIETAHRRATLRGRVLRCGVVRLRASSIWYRAAIAFDRQLSVPGDDRSTEYQVPAGEAASTHALRVDPTRDTV